MHPDIRGQLDKTYLQTRTTWKKRQSKEVTCFSSRLITKALVEFFLEPKISAKYGMFMGIDMDKIYFSFFSAFFSGQFTFDEGKTWKYPRLFIAASENDENHCRFNNNLSSVMKKVPFFTEKRLLPDKDI